jgi:monoamine oxidase
MARTPLLSSLQQLGQDLTESQRSGKPVAQIQEERRGRRWSRREFVKATGATLGAAALSGAVPAFAATGSTGTPRIAIVGGGIAGLNAALTLASAGVPSTIYEASATRIGGRMHSDSPLVSTGDTYWANGQVSEYCGELIDSNHKTIRHLAQQFGLVTDDLIQAEPSGTTETYYFNGGYYPYAQATEDFKPVHNTLQGQIQATGYPTLYNSSTSAGQFFDSISVYDWIERYVPGGHASSFGQLLDSAYNQEYGAETNQQSSLNLIYLLAFQPKPGEFSIYGASDERYHIQGGNQRLPEAMRDYLLATKLVTIPMGMRMKAIAGNSDGSWSLTFDGVTKPVVADRVILCMSFSVLRTLNYKAANFDSLKQTAITQLGSGVNAKLDLQFDDRYWNGVPVPGGFANGDIYTNIGFQNTWDVTRAQPGSTGILVNYAGGNVAAAYQPSTPYSNASTNPQVVTYAKQFLQKLETVFPGVSSHWINRAVLSAPFLDPNLLCSYSYWKVGQYTQFSGYEKARQPFPNGKCHFAGEHCSQDFQGFMEGGASEGARAANEILSDYKSGIFP